MSVLPTLIITILTLSLALRYWAFPLLFRRLTQFRVSSFSLITVRGLEWRAAVQADSIVPTLRVERAGWAWGGLKGEEVGLVILRLEGVSYRVKGDAAKIASSKDEHPPWLKVRCSSRLSFPTKRFYVVIAPLLRLQGQTSFQASAPFHPPLPVPCSPRFSPSRRYPRHIR